MAIRQKSMACAWVVCAVVFATHVSAQEVIPGAAKAWQLDIEFEDPQRISFRLPGDATPTTYWYVLYRVTNNTGRDVQFMPSARLLTDTLDKIHAGDNIHPNVYRRIAALHKNDFPFFAKPSKVTGLLLQGEQNARSSAWVFRTFDKAANSFTIFVSGLSGLIDRIPNPVFDTKSPESDDNPRSFVRRLTLAIDYLLPGDENTRAAATPRRTNRKWVMR